MNHADHVNLIRGGVRPGTGADFGSGAGAFTLALAELLGSGGEIISVDRGARPRSAAGYHARLVP